MQKLTRPFLALALMFSPLARISVVCAQSSECGNGFLDPGEECDDGNTVSGDGCDSLCRQEFVEDTCWWDAWQADLNNSGAVTSADVIYLINYTFKGGPEPFPCATNGDLNCSGAVNAGDIIVLVAVIFRGAPFPCDVCYESPLGPGCP